MDPLIKNPPHLLFGDVGVIWVGQEVGGISMTNVEQYAPINVSAGRRGDQARGLTSALISLLT